MYHQSVVKCSFLAGALGLRLMSRTVALTLALRVCIVSRVVMLRRTISR